MRSPPVIKAVLFGAACALGGCQDLRNDAVVDGAVRDLGGGNEPRAQSAPFTDGGPADAAVVDAPAGEGGPAPDSAPEVAGEAAAAPAQGIWDEGLWDVAEWAP